MLSVMSSPHRGNITAASDDADAYNYNNISGGLRRRHTVTRADNNVEYMRKNAPRRDQAQSQTKEVHGFPKKLTPFFQLNDPATGFSTPPRSVSPQRERLESRKREMHEEKKAAVPLPPALSFSSGDEEDQTHEKGERVKKTKFVPRRENRYIFAANLPMTSVEDDLQNSGITAMSEEFGDAVGNSETSVQTMEITGRIEKSDGDRVSSRSSEDVSDADTHGASTVRTTMDNIQKGRRYIGKIVNNEYVQVTIILLIIINAVMMGISTYPFIKDNKPKAEFYGAVDKAFLWIFTVEVSMQLTYLCLLFFTDKWLVFDFVIVLISHFAEKIQVIRAFRIFRMFRLITRVKPLRDLILALGKVMPRMTAICFLLMIIFYVYAVLFTELFGELELEEAYFNTLWDSLFTSFQMMTLEWAEVCREVNEQKKWAWIVFVSFIMIAGFIVFNLIVAVVVEAVAATEDTVRALDGLEDESPEARLMEAQERIDLLQLHLNDMMDQQEQIQFMLETMAGELLHLETERMKAKHRETQLRGEINWRIEYQQKMEAKKLVGEHLPERRSKREASMKRHRSQSGAESLSTSLHREDSSRTPLNPRRLKSFSSWTVKPAMVKENSCKSFSGDSANSGYTEHSGTYDAPKSAPTIRRKLDLSIRSAPSASGKYLGGTEDDRAAKSKKAKESWKKLLAVQKL